MRIFIATDCADSTISIIRLVNPLQRLASIKKYTIIAKNFSAFEELDIISSDIVVIQRGANLDALRVAEICSTLRKPYIYEMDDLLTEIPDFMSHHEGYIKKKSTIEKLIACASAVTVTNNRLKDAISHLSNSIFICPNYHAQITPATQPSAIDPSQPAHLIVASSDKIRLDFLSPALIEIKKKFGSAVTIIAVGPVGTALQSQDVDCIARPMIAHQDFVPTLAKLPNAIGIIPLDESFFSSCKSSVKYYDYAIGGIATICSDVPPYSDDITHGVNGLLTANTTQAWVSNIASMIENAQLRATLVHNARELVLSKHNVQANTEAWEQVFNHVAPNDIAISVPKDRRLTRPLLAVIKDYIRDLNRQRRQRRRVKRQIA